MRSNGENIERVKQALKDCGFEIGNSTAYYSEVKSIYSQIFGSKLEQTREACISTAASVKIFEEDGELYARIKYEQKTESPYRLKESSVSESKYVSIDELHKYLKDKGFDVSGFEGNYDETLDYETER